MARSINQVELLTQTKGNLISPAQNLTVLLMPEEIFKPRVNM